MSRFADDWLALREPFDHAARRDFDDALSAIGRDQDPMPVVDLGAGTGSNFRYLAPKLGRRQRWVLIDKDKDLLSAAEAAFRVWPGAQQSLGPDGPLSISGPSFEARIVLLELDLARKLASVEFRAGCLVTAAALLDLVSASWLEALVEKCREAEATVLLALTYDGRTHCEPEEPEDRLVEGLVNEHQLLDKGFGPALGPAASQHASELLGAAGYALERRASDWQLEPRDAPMQRALVEGWYRAATEIAPERPLNGWLERRRAHIAAGRSRLTVGHEDIFARLSVDAR